MLVYILTVIGIVTSSAFTKIKFSDSPISLTQQENINQNQNRFFMLVTWLILGLVSGLRWGVGTDYWQYSVNYSLYRDSSWGNISIFDEPGIKIISKISSSIYNDYTLMFLIISLLTVFLIEKTIFENSRMITLSLLLFVFTGVWHGTFNIIRQYIAAAIIFSGHKYIVEKQFFKYVLICILASLFHISAIVFLLLYFIPKKKIKNRHLVLIIIFIIVAITSYDSMINIAGFLKNKTISVNSYLLKEVNVFRVLTKVIPVPFYFIFSKKNYLSKKDNFYINMMFVNAALVVATSNSAYLSRLWIYTDLFSLLYYPVILDIKLEKLKPILVILVLFFYFLFWTYEIIITPNLYDFKWIFER